MTTNEFNAVGRLVAVRPFHGRFNYVMYVQNMRIEFSATFSLPEDIELLDYVEVNGYINGRNRVNEDGTLRHSQSYIATSVSRAEAELASRFDMPGSAADTYFNVYLAGTIDSVDQDGRMDIRITASPEMQSKRSRIVRTRVSKTRFPDFNGVPGDDIYVFAHNITKDVELPERIRSYQHLNVEDYALVKNE